MEGVWERYRKWGGGGERDRDREGSRRGLSLYK